MEFFAVGADADLVVSNALSILKAKLIAQGYKEDDLQVAVMRSVIALKNNTPALSFPYSKSNGTVLKPTECYIENTDAFAFGMAQLSVAKVVESAAGAPFLSAAKFESFVDKSVFDFAVVPNSLSEGEQLCQLYNAKLNLDTAGTNSVKDFPTHLLHEAAVGNSVAGAQNGTGAASELHGYQNLRKCVLWAGGKDNKAQINFFSDVLTAGWEGAAGSKNYVALDLLGFRIRNGATSIETNNLINDDSCSGSFALL